MELREIKLSTILLRIKACKKLQDYKQAYEDATKLWYLMSPSERKQNSHFKIEYIYELKLLRNYTQPYQTKQVGEER